MNEEKHTPGPWILDGGDCGDPEVGLGPTPLAVIAQIGVEDVPICTLDDPCVRAAREPTDEFDECADFHGSAYGNGLLIRAAPDLLAALEEMLRLFDGRAPMACRAAKIAIAKARGEGPAS